MGNRILLSRRDLGVNQDHISTLSGVSRTYISQLERGSSDNVSVDIVFAIARALGVSPAYLMGLTDNPLSRVDDEDEPLTLVDPKAAYTTDPATRELLTLIDDMTPGQRTQLVGIARVLATPSRIIE